MFFTSRLLYTGGSERSKNLLKGTAPAVILETMHVSYIFSGVFITKLPADRSQAAELTSPDDYFFFAPLFASESKSDSYSLRRDYLPFQVGLKGTLLNNHECQQSFRIRKQHKWSQMPVSSSTKPCPDGRVGIFTTMLYLDQHLGKLAEDRLLQR